MPLRMLLQATVTFRLATFLCLFRSSMAAGVKGGSA